MEQQVLVIVSSTIEQIDAPEEQASMEVTVPGAYYTKNGKHYVIYEEHDEDSHTAIKTILIFNQEYLDMKKTGGVEAVMSFEPGRENKSFYVTPYGKVLMGVGTKKYQFEEQGNQMVLKVVYDLSMEQMIVSKHELTITIRFMQR